MFPPRSSRQASPPGRASIDADNKTLIVSGQANLIENATALDDLERIRRLFDDIENKKELIQLLGLAEAGEGVRIFIGSENKLFSLVGLLDHHCALPQHRGKDRRRAWRHRPDAHELCAHRPDGGLYGTGHRPPHDLIFLCREPICPLINLISDAQGNVAMNDETKTPDTPEATPNMDPSLAFPEDFDFDPREAEIAELKEEAGGLKDKLLRLAAEMDNLRKRTEREKAEATLYAASNFARDLLSVADNLGRAIGAVPAESRETADEVSRNLLAGVEVTERELLNIFQRHGIRRIEAVGQKFDPNMHQAMFEVPDNGEAPGTVVQQLQAGYAIGDRCLRPSLVGVAKAGE